MYILYAKSKTQYAKGQIFPFLIAVMVTVVIIAMITVNLGQIGVFKTDVSNAADAGALAGASILSSSLLGLGLRSDMMCGEMMVMVGVILAYLLSVIGIPAAIASYLALLINQLVNYFQALEEGKMAWSNAKKTALQYAFQNAGIDEPRPTFQDFLKQVYGISEPDSLSADAIKSYYNIYFQGDDPTASSEMRKKVKIFSQSGFSRFLETTAYWNDAWGQIKPGRISPAILKSGYGWNGDGKNSYLNPLNNNYNYKSYDNYVEVEAMGHIMYPLQIYNPLGELATKINDWIEDNLSIPWWLTWMFCPVCWILSLFNWMWAIMPGGLWMPPIEENTDRNPVTVTVRRFKKNNQLGLWNFRYGTVESASAAHAYRETSDVDIKPVLFSGEDLFDLILSGFSNWKDVFDTSKHLFETEIIQVR